MKKYLIQVYPLVNLTGVTRGVEEQQLLLTVVVQLVTSTTNYVAWGEAASGDLVLEPGMWSLDNFGDKAICLIHDSAVFEWDSSASNATDNNRATIISGAPTASRHMLVSTPDRHLVFFGTETTIGDTSTQDDMFVRFSDQEDINTYTPTATNTAGTQRLADGSQIRGAIEVEMQFMFGLTQHYLHNVLLVNHLRLVFTSWN